MFSLRVYPAFFRRSALQPVRQGIWVSRSHKHGIFAPIHSIRSPVVRLEETDFYGSLKITKWRQLLSYTEKYSKLFELENSSDDQKDHDPGSSGLDDAHESPDFQALIDGYKTLIGRGAKLRPGESLSIIMLLRASADKSFLDIDYLDEEVEQFYQFFKSKQLPYHPLVPCLLIRYYLNYRDLVGKAAEVWEWVVNQPESSVFHSSRGPAFAPAIRLTARYGDLSQCEILFQQWCTESFSPKERHFISDNATIPEPHLPGPSLVSSREATTTNVLHVFYSIFDARLLLGDWRKAYLALDTVLRLSPTNILPKFMTTIVQKRPAYECYVISYALLHTGLHVTEKALRGVLYKLTQLSPRRGTDYAFSVMQMAMSLIHASVAAKRVISPQEFRYFGECVLSAFLPGESSKSLFGSFDTRVWQTRIVEQLESLAKFLGINLGEEWHVSVSEQAARLGNTDLYRSAMRHIQDSPLRVHSEYLRSTLIPAAMLGLFQDIQQYWTAHTVQFPNLSQESWKCLAEATLLCGTFEFFDKQLQKRLGPEAEGMRVTLRRHIEHYKSRAETFHDSILRSKTIHPAETWERYVTRVQRLVQSLHRIEYVGSLEKFSDIALHPPEVVISSEPCQVSSIEQWAKEFYDELPGQVSYHMKERATTTATELEVSPIRLHLMPLETRTGLSLDSAQQFTWVFITLAMSYAQKRDDTLEQLFPDTRGRHGMRDALTYGRQSVLEEDYIELNKLESGITEGHLQSTDSITKKQWVARTKRVREIE